MARAISTGISSPLRKSAWPRPPPLASAEPQGSNRPLIGPPAGVPSRTYAAIGVSRRGRRSALSNRAAVPLVAAPSPPSQPTIAYDEAAVEEFSEVLYTLQEVEVAGWLRSLQL